MSSRTALIRVLGRIGGAVLLAGLFLEEICVGQGAGEPARRQLEAILGSSAEDWRVGHYSGTTNDYRLTDGEDGPVLVAGPNATVLTSLHQVTADSEVTVRLRLAAEEGKATSVHCIAGLKSADAATQNPLFLNLHVPAAAEQESVICQMPALPGRPQGVYAPYTVRSLPKNRLTWPEMVRARVEQDVASVRSLEKRWLTLRYVIREKSAQVYLDGRLLRDVKGAGTGPEGHIRLSVPLRSFPG